MSLDELRAFLTEKSEVGETLGFERDDFNPNDHYGGNGDDIYDAGVSDGEASMARTILARLDK